MDQGKQVQAQMYNKNTRVLPAVSESCGSTRSRQNIWTPAEIIQCPTNEGRSCSLRTIHGGVYTRNRRFIKPDVTEAALPEPRPETEPRMTRPTRTIKKPDRLIESK